MPGFWRPKSKLHARRICRERKTLTAERVEHVNRIKGLLFAQDISDYEPLLRKRRERLELEELRTGDGRPLPEHLKAQIGRELDPAFPTDGRLPLMPDWRRRPGGADPSRTNKASPKPETRGCEQP